MIETGCTKTPIEREGHVQTSDCSMMRSADCADLRRPEEKHEKSKSSFKICIAQ